MDSISNLRVALQSPLLTSNHFKKEGAEVLQQSLSTAEGRLRLVSWYLTPQQMRLACLEQLEMLATNWCEEYSFWHNTVRDLDEHIAFGTELLAAAADEERELGPMMLLAKLGEDLAVFRTRLLAKLRC